MIIEKFGAQRPFTNIVRALFERLMNASKNNLRAFENAASETCTDNGTGTGMRQGIRNGNGQGRRQAW